MKNIFAAVFVLITMYVPVGIAILSQFIELDPLSFIWKIAIFLGFIGMVSAIPYSLVRLIRTIF